MVTQAGLSKHVLDARGSKQSLRPDEVLFKRANAPIRYEEADHYHAHEDLAAKERLPIGDLLEALHAYVSAIYSKTPMPGGYQSTWKFMDETALIALGILMEETAGRILGDTGDLAFTEGMSPSGHSKIEDPEETTARPVINRDDALSDSDELTMSDDSY